MNEPTVYEVIADAFAAEKVDTLFALLGDANMHWGVDMAKRHGVRIVHARHEHCAVAMADGYARATGRVGVATTTCGPGFTQIATALTVAVRHGVPMVVFAGDTPIGDPFHNQHFEQRPLAEATGANFIGLRDVNRLLNDVREAFYVARHEHHPVVLSVPMDLQLRTFPWAAQYQVSGDVLPRPQRPMPDPELVAQAVRMIRESQRPIVLAGEGAVKSGAADAIAALGDQAGALLATTLRAKGLFDDRPYDLGIAGAFASDVARELFAGADLVIGVGASLSYYTTEGGYFYPDARIIQIDTRPRGIWQGQKVADLHLAADAKTGVNAIVEALRMEGARRAGYRTEEVAKRIAAGGPDSRPMPLEPDTVDPRNAMLELDQAIPKDWNVVTGIGHFANWVTHLHGRAAERYFITHDFGAIGQGLATAIGVAAGRGDGKVVLIEGDGTLLMHIQELEVMIRQGLHLLICVFNDGAYGAEVHKLRGLGVDPAELIFGRTDLARIASAFGLRAATIRKPDEMQRLFAEHVQGKTSTLWDIHIAGNVPSAQYRRLYFGEA